jgi:chemotaxis protein CheC
MKIEPEIVDAIREIINIGIGNAASKLADLTGARIKLEVPEIRILSLEELSRDNNLEHQRPMAMVYLEFMGKLSGKTALMIPPESAAKLVTLLTHDTYDTAELDAVMVDTLKEVGNIIVNSVMGSISNILDEKLDYSLPSYYQSQIFMLIRDHRWNPEDQVIFAYTNFSVMEKNITGQILIILDIESLDLMIRQITEMEHGR